MSIKLSPKLTSSLRGRKMAGQPSRAASHRGVHKPAKPATPAAPVTSHRSRAQPARATTNPARPAPAAPAAPRPVSARAASHGTSPRQPAAPVTSHRSRAQPARAATNPARPAPAAPAAPATTAPAPAATTLTSTAAPTSGPASYPGAPAGRNVDQRQNQNWQLVQALKASKNPQQQALFQQMRQAYHGGGDGRAAAISQYLQQARGMLYPGR